VTVSYEIEKWPTRTTNYNVRNDYRKIECDYRERPKTSTFL